MQHALWKVWPTFQLSLDREGEAEDPHSSRKHNEKAFFDPTLWNAPWGLVIVIRWPQFPTSNAPHIFLEITTPIPAKNKTPLHDCAPHFLAIASSLCLAWTTSRSYLNSEPIWFYCWRGVWSGESQIWFMRARGQNTSVQSLSKLAYGLNKVCLSRKTPTIF